MMKQKKSHKRRLIDQLEEDIIENDDSIEELAENHANEKWLLSYADMMTLLFGLFVMLYTIAMSTKGQPDRVISDIVSGRKSSINPELELKNKIKEVEDLKNQIQKLNGQITISENKAREITDENIELVNKIDRLQEEMTQLQEKLSAFNQNQIGINNSISDQSHLKELIEKKEAEVRGLKEKVQNLNKEISGLLVKIDGFSTENSGLKKDILGLKEDVKTSNFMIVVLNWNTSLHDLDLRVTDPFGRMFDFKNRDYKESKARFVIDSRTGPGVEMWETPQIELGEYTIEYNFYNSYGNKEPAVLTGSIITRRGVFDIPTVKLDFLTSKKKLFKIKTTELGSITILPQL